MPEDDKSVCFPLCSTMQHGHGTRHPAAPHNSNMGRFQINSMTVVVVAVRHVDLFDPTILLSGEANFLYILTDWNSLLCSFACCVDSYSCQCWQSILKLPGSCFGILVMKKPNIK